LAGVKQYVQATAAWQWYNWTLQRVPKDKKPLRMNFGETSCRLFCEAAPGILGSESVATSAKKGFITQQVTRHQTRGALSLLAVLCDDTTIQPSVPQVIIGNERCLPEGDRKALEENGALMKNVIVLRRKSAWVMDEVLSHVVAIWGNALRACRLTHQPILLLDVCSTHMGLASSRHVPDGTSGWCSSQPRLHGCCSLLTHTALHFSKGVCDGCLSRACWQAVMGLLTSRLSLSIWIAALEQFSKADNGQQLLMSTVGRGDNNL